MSDLKSLPCTLMRGGTSKGPYILKSDLPENIEIRDSILLAAMGSPDNRQIDGIGGATTLTSKVAIVGPSHVEGRDVNYYFAQVEIEEARVDTNPSCGNMLAGVGPFAIEQGLIPVGGDETIVQIFDINTETKIDAVIQTPDGKVRYDGDSKISGVPGTAAPVRLRFRDAGGSKTSGILPTGNPIDVINGVETTCIDVAMPMVLMRAEDVGITGYESKAELDSNNDLFGIMEPIRLQAGKIMGLGDVSKKVIPKIGLLAPPKQGGSITSRYFVPTATHAAHAVTGGICVATAAVMRGTVAEGLSQVARCGDEDVIIEHPSGKLEIELSVEGSGPGLTFIYGGVIRTTRKLFSGNLFVPERVWPG